MLGLLIFRLLWGLSGTTHARLSTLFYPPRLIWQYMLTLPQKDSRHFAGHNPVGALSVLLMLSLLLIQTISGLFADDDIFTAGPWNHAISSEWQDIMNNFHHLTFDIILIVIGLHLSAILFYRFYKGQRLPEAMIHGKKLLANEPELTSHLTGRALWVASMAALLCYLIIEVLPPEKIDYFSY